MNTLQHFSQHLLTTSTQTNKQPHTHACTHTCTHTHDQWHTTACTQAKHSEPREENHARTHARTHTHINPVAHNCMHTGKAFKAQRRKPDTQPKGWANYQHTMSAVTGINITHLNVRILKLYNCQNNGPWSNLDTDTDHILALQIAAVVSVH